ncbi:MAG: hypothetical protein ACE37N_02040 [Pseudohongiellaceae bacterium]
MLPANPQTSLTLAAMVLLVLFLLWLGGKLRGYWMRQRHQQQHLVDTINELLPQTQCGRCSYEGCLPVPVAEEAINKWNGCRRHAACTAAA